MKSQGKLLAVWVGSLLLIAGAAFGGEKATDQETTPAQQEKMTEQVKSTKAQTEKKTGEMAEAKKAQAEKQAGEMAEAKKAQAEKQAGEMADAKKSQAQTKSAQRAEAKKAQPEAEAPEGMTLSRLAICEDVQERTPVGEADSFHHEIGKLWCFTRVQNAVAPTQIFHRWYINDKLVDEIPINVKSRHWRCWSTKTILPSWTGECRVEILTEEGDVLATKSFTLEG